MHIEGVGVEYGLSMRDYFAAQALAGLYAGEGLRHEPKWYAEEAWKSADAMLAEREKNETASNS